MMILGLDISTSTIGWCLMRDNGNLVDCGYIRLDKLNDMYEKLRCFEKFLDEKIVHLENDLQIYIEEALMMFKTKSSMAQVIAMLQRFNGMCSASIYYRLNVKPELVNVNTARKICNIKVPKKVNAKEYVLSHVQGLNIIPQEKWELNRNQKLIKQMFDMCDAWVIAKSGCALNARKQVSVS
jgi:Holliday junction resolvasome RuvABC endonuclease subunit